MDPRIASLYGIGVPPAASPRGPAPTADTGGSFEEALARAGAAIVAPHDAEVQAVDAFVSGADGDVHNALLAVSKAEISLKYLVNVRNKVVDAYREVLKLS